MLLYTTCTSTQSLATHSDNPQQQLWSAVILNQEDTVLALLSEGVDPNSDYHLHNACQYKNLTIATLLLKYGADVARCDSTDSTALHSACFNNSIDCAKLLLDHGSLSGELPVCWVSASVHCSYPSL